MKLISFFRIISVTFYMADCLRIHQAEKKVHSSETCTQRKSPYYDHQTAFRYFEGQLSLCASYSTHLLINLRPRGQKPTFTGPRRVNIVHRNF